MSGGVFVETQDLRAKAVQIKNLNFSNSLLDKPIVFDDAQCMVKQIWRLARFYAHESCAQCTQCREGTAWVTKILERIENGQGQMRDLDTLLELSENMTGKTICVLSDSCAAPIVSGIQKFRHEFEAHISGKRCPMRTTAAA